MPLAANGPDYCRVEATRLAPSTYFWSRRRDKGDNGSEYGLPRAPLRPAFLRFNLHTMQLTTLYAGSQGWARP